MRDESFYRSVLGMIADEALDAVIRARKPKSATRKLYRYARANRRIEWLAATALGTPAPEVTDAEAAELAGLLNLAEGALVR